MMFIRFCIKFVNIFIDINNVQFFFFVPRPKRLELFGKDSLWKFDIDVFTMVEHF